MYLKELWGHTLDSIRKARGDTILEALTFHIVITVPAIWKDYAREAMQQAASMAGMLSSRPAGKTTLTFAPEPEAAALSSLSDCKRSVDVGDVYVILDAGGGTVVSTEALRR